MNEHIVYVGLDARFGQPRQLMAYLALVPAEHSSGAHRRQGSILTRVSNGIVGRVA